MAGYGEKVGGGGEGVEVDVAFGYYEQLWKLFISSRKLWYVRHNDDMGRKKRQFAKQEKFTCSIKQVFGANSTTLLKYSL